ncbi:MAG TPA: RNA-splicing ligase RtcB [Bacteroidetes bacterium]|nr:RNA-splicing ligase RtcB [Bacteroidota bacterium]
MLKKLDEHRFLIPKSFRDGMTVEGLIYANEELIKAIEQDQTMMQVANVATLPGLVGRSLAMPDAHQGYGFAIGGVAASDYQKGVVSAGGVGFDINCGVRLLTSELGLHEVKPKLDALLNQMFRDIPCGTGRKGIIGGLGAGQLDDVLENGAQWAIRNGYGTDIDLHHIEEGGKIPHADPNQVSKRAKERGRGQLGTLGSGNHFAEVQYVAEVFNEEAASLFGLREGRVVVLIHTGSRGLGHQVCTDYLEIMQDAMRKYNIKLVDRQLACVPIQSPEGAHYLGAMAAAANFAFANRQMITHWTREAFARVLGKGDLKIVYDVCHNIAKRETHKVGGEMRDVLVHRKGATRAFPKHSPEIPKDYFEVGQPVLIPGSMGTCSYVLVGTEKAMEETFGSSCHGAGRSKSRHAAKKEITAERLIESLREKGIHVRGASKSGLTEENPNAYKDVSQVVDVVHDAGIAKKVAKLVPIGVIKG